MYLTVLIMIDVLLKKIKIFNFFGKAQKRTKLSENDIYIYLKLSPKYGVKLPSQKEVMGVQSRRDCISAGDFGTGTWILCEHETIGRSWN